MNDNLDSKKNINYKLIIMVSISIIVLLLIIINIISYARAEKEREDAISKVKTIEDTYPMVVYDNAEFDYRNNLINIKDPNDKSYMKKIKVDGSTYYDPKNGYESELDKNNDKISYIYKVTNGDKKLIKTIDDFDKCYKGDNYYYCGLKMVMYNREVISFLTASNGYIIDLNGNEYKLDYGVYGSRASLCEGTDEECSVGVNSSKYFELIKRDEYDIEKNIYGLYNYEDKKTQIEPQYDFIRVIDDNHIIATKDGKTGLIDSNNNILAPFDYDFIDYDYYDTLDAFLVSKDDKLYLMDKNYNLSIDFNIKNPNNKDFAIGLSIYDSFSHLSKIGDKYILEIINKDRMPEKTYLVDMNEVKDITDLDYYSIYDDKYLIVNDGGNLVFYDDNLNKVNVFANVFNDNKDIYINTIFDIVKINGTSYKNGTSDKLDEGTSLRYKNLKFKIKDNITYLDITDENSHTVVSDATDFYVVDSKLVVNKDNKVYVISGIDTDFMQNRDV